MDSKAAARGVLIYTGFSPGKGLLARLKGKASACVRMRYRWKFAFKMLKKGSEFLNMKSDSHTSVTCVRRILFGLAAVGFLLCLDHGALRAATFSVDVAPGGQLVFSPSSVSIQVGDTVTWTWKASGHSVTSGVPGASSGLFDSGISNAGKIFSHTFTDPGTFAYYCKPHGGCCGMVASVTVAAPSPTPDPNVPARPLNISTRLGVQADDQVLIAGFTIDGSVPKRILLRAIGPSLGELGIPNPLADPFLELHASDQTTITTNDNWKVPAEADIDATGLAPANDLESAIVITLDPGQYTAIVKGNENGTGVALVDVYDIDESTEAQLTNISTRGFVGMENDVMIGGFILGGGGGSATVLVRAIGPTLTGLGVTGALADPTLELRDANAMVVRSNDNWKDSQRTDIEGTNLQPPDDLESAVLSTLMPGQYTAIVAGKDGLTGVALVEVYRLP